MAEAKAPECIADVDEAMVMMSAELQIAEIVGDEAKAADIRKFIDQALDIRLRMADG